MPPSRAVPSTTYRPVYPPVSIANRFHITLPHPSDFTAPGIFEEQITFTRPMLETFADTITVYIHRPIDKPTPGKPWRMALPTHTRVGVGRLVRVGRCGRGIVTEVHRHGRQYITFTIFEFTRSERIYLMVRREWADMTARRVPKQLLAEESESGSEACTTSRLPYIFFSLEA
ncbi:hypothetical protein BKA93DRAFT_821720 [Sparassis latifolia]